MLQALDSLIGFALVMVLLSTAVTFLVQAISTVLNLRGTALLKGISDLLIQVNPALAKMPNETQSLAEAVLRHPSVAGFSSFLGIPLGRRTLAPVITREELVQVLLSLGDDVDLTKEAQKAIEQLLRDAKISEPKALLQKIRDTALRLEKDCPTLAADVRMSRAILDGFAQQGKTLLADLHAGFDNGIERVRDLFTNNARLATLVAAIFVVMLIPVDSVQLFRALWAEPQLRASLVESAQALDLDKAPGLQAPDEVRKALSAHFDAAEPKGEDLLPGTSVFSMENLEKHLLGLLLTVILLCLGAPFWFDLLKNLLNLRPMLAGKEEKERASRSEGTTPPADGAAQPITP